MLRTWIAAAALVTAWTGAAAAQDVEKGAISFKKCAICHKIGPGATNLVGPVLNGLDGRHSGSVAGFSYSMPTRIPASSGTNRPLPSTSRTQGPKSPVPR
jgi:cytochrome c2